MIIRRPMRTRQMTGAMFGEPAVLVKRMQTRNRRGEATFTEDETPIRLATNPLSPTDPRVASLQQGGIRIEDSREFFTIQTISTEPPDYIKYDDGNGEQEYIAHSTARWGHYSSSIFYRRESQT